MRMKYIFSTGLKACLIVIVLFSTLRIYHLSYSGLNHERVTVGQEDILIPSIERLKTLNTSGFLSLIHSYTNSYQILCRKQLRVGKIQDGGKEICIDEPIKPKKPCLVYSFGSKNVFDFETSVIHWFGCEVHTFDPSMTGLTTSQIKSPPGCTFHGTGLGAKNAINKDKWSIKTLGQHVKDLHHENRPLDILKVDVEGDEWTALDQMIDSGDIFRVRQLQVELHFPLNGRNFTHQLMVLKKLYDAGFRIFNRERNVYCKVCTRYHEEVGFQVAHNVEVCFINKNYL